MRPWQAAANDAAPENPAQARRRGGFLWLALAVVLLAGQGLLEWPLPPDAAALETLRQALGVPALGAATVSLAWGLACLLALALLWRLQPAKRGTVLAALLAGTLLGSARCTSGGTAGALVLLAATGLGTLGWQSMREGGLALLLGAALGAAAWDTVLSGSLALWPVGATLAAIFFWIERRLLRPAQQRLATVHEALRTQREQTQRLQQQRAQMLSRMAHSLRQPLWAMSLYTDTLMRRTQSAEGVELLQRQASALADTSGMLDQFSQLAAIERGLLTVRSEPVDLRELLLSVVSQLVAAQRPPVPTIRVHGRPLKVRTDRTHLTVIVQALAQHAVRQAVAARGEAARVVLAVRRQAQGCMIDVLDNGPGIDPERMAHAFEPYAPLDASSNSGRQGLSLTIAQGLAASLGLAIEVRSLPQRGTRFRVQVPAALRADGPAA